MGCNRQPCREGLKNNFLVRRILRAACWAGERIIELQREGRERLTTRWQTVEKRHEQSKVEAKIGVKAEFTRSK